MWPPAVSCTSPCSEKKREASISQSGLPGRDWDDINDRVTLVKALEQTRAQGCISFPDSSTGQMIVVGLILADGYPPAAIGFGIEGDALTETLALTAEPVKAIEKNLKPREIIF
jgi:DNA-binding IclR family transcriptional regulator